MARVRNILYVVAVLTSANFIIAEEGSGYSDSGPPNHHQKGNSNIKQNPLQSLMDGFSSFGNSEGSGGNPFSGFNPFSGSASGNPFGGLGGSGNPVSGFSSPFGSSLGSSRGHISTMNGDNESDKSTEESDSDSQSEEHAENRLFFSSLFNTRLTTCNYTTQAGASCFSCREVLRCRVNNVATVRRCGHFFPYCNNGRCSLFPGAACNPTTAVAATTTEAAATTTNAATTNAATTNAATTQ